MVVAAAAVAQVLKNQDVAQWPSCGQGPVDSKMFGGGDHHADAGGMGLPGSIRGGPTAGGMQHSSSSNSMKGLPTLNGSDQPSPHYGSSSRNGLRSRQGTDGGSKASGASGATTGKVSGHSLSAILGDVSSQRLLEKMSTGKRRDSHATAAGGGGGAAAAAGGGGGGGGGGGSSAAAGAGRRSDGGDLHKPVGHSSRSGTSGIGWNAGRTSVSRGDPGSGIGGLASIPSTGGMSGSWKRDDVRDTTSRDGGVSVSRAWGALGRLADQAPCWDQGSVLRRRRRQLQEEVVVVVVVEWVAWARLHHCHRYNVVWGGGVSSSGSGVGGGGGGTAMGGPSGASGPGGAGSQGGGVWHGGHAALTGNLGYSSFGHGLSMGHHGHGYHDSHHGYGHTSSVHSLHSIGNSVYNQHGRGHDAHGTRFGRSRYAVAWVV